MEPDRATEVRNAVASGDFERAHGLWDEYVTYLQDELRRGSLTRAQLEEARELFEWARLTVLCARAHIQHRLNTLRVAEAYGEPLPSEARRIVQTCL